MARAKWHALYKRGLERRKVVLGRELKTRKREREKDFTDKRHLVLFLLCAYYFRIFLSNEAKS